VRDEQGNLSDEKLEAIAAHEQVRMFEIKLAQGANPGKGASFPGPRSPRRSLRSGVSPRARTASRPTGIRKLPLFPIFWT